MPRAPCRAAEPVPHPGQARPDAKEIDAEAFARHWRKAKGQDPAQVQAQGAAQNQALARLLEPKFPCCIVLRLFSVRISFGPLQEARARRDTTMRFDPTTMFFIVLLIGVVIGVVFDRFGGRGWLSRQMSGGRHVLVTSALVGVCASFIGYHL